MNRETFAMKLQELRHKQQLINKACEKTSKHQLLELFTDIIPRALDVERCSIFILDPKANKVWLHSGTGMKQKEIQVPKWSSMVGQVITTGEYRVEYDMNKSVGTHDMVDLQTGFTTKNALCVPIRSVTADKTTGAIQVLNKKDDEKYTDDDRTLLEKVAFNIQMDVESMFLRQETIKISEEIEKRIQLFEENFKRNFP